MSKAIVIAFILLSCVFLEVQAGFFSRGYVNYLLNRQADNGVIPLSRVSSPTSSFVPRDQNLLIKRPFLGVSPWVIVEDAEGNVRLVDKEQSI
ncbi:hypothetical protein QR680_015919 [Steinernema hermaphroditum]|uniref:Uncharacterized protein n=1 Tax=Steinernema hermaphroditum TaxID=289476 RepID=A0AA39H9E9_9BILA|nr:hypothetical protein QR680_015919 [Steinernema hermaphroditum]